MLLRGKRARMMYIRTNFIAKLSACLLAGGASVAACAAPIVPSANTDTSLSEAKTHFQQEHFKTTLKLLDRHLQSHPDDRDARFLQGLALARQGKVDEAINVFELLTKQHPNQPEPFNNLAVLYAQQGQFDRARNVLLDAIRTHHSYATAYENLGSIYAKMAINAYASALDLKKQEVANDIRLTLLDDLSAPQGTAVSVAQAKPQTAPPRATTKADSPARPEPAAKIQTTNAHQLQVEQQVLNTILE